MASVAMPLAKSTKRRPSTSHSSALSARAVKCGVSVPMPCAQAAFLRACRLALVVTWVSMKKKK
ncbi:hypothetical protein D3C72_2306350 [compost metagenome]